MSDQENSENDDDGDEQDLDPINEHLNQTRQGSSHHLSDRMSFSSLDHELTLKDKQDVGDYYFQYN
jgi:hypothetical protein